MKKKAYKIHTFGIIVVVAACFLTGCTNYEKDGMKAMNAGDYKLAVENFTQAAQKAEDKGKREAAAEAYRALGMAYYEKKDYQNVQESLQKALDLGGERSAEIYNIIAVSAMQQEEYESALKAFEEGISYASSSDAVNAPESKKGVDYTELIQEMRYNQIICYEKLLDWENAKNTASDYIADYPNDDKVQREIEFLRTR